MSSKKEDIKLKLDVEIDDIINNAKSVTESGGFKDIKKKALLDKELKFLSAAKEQELTRVLATSIQASAKRANALIQSESLKDNVLSKDANEWKLKISKAENVKQEIEKKLSEVREGGQRRENGPPQALLNAYKNGSFDLKKVDIFAKIKDEFVKNANILDTNGKKIKSFSRLSKGLTEGTISEASLTEAQNIFQKYNSETGTEVLKFRKHVQELIESLDKATKAFEDVQKEYNNSDLSKKVPSEYNKSVNSDLNIGSNVRNLNSILDDEKASMEAFDATTSSINKQQTALAKAFKQLTIYAVGLRLVKQAAREAVRTITDLDKSLTEQAMVTGVSREQTYELTKNYRELALQVGATTKEIAEVATEYMKQGQTIADSLTLTEAAVAAAKVARVSVGDSVNYLTTALNGFQLSAEDAMKVSDKFAAVAAASASDYDELAIALSKVASQANLAGMSIDYTTALLTKGLETTREAPETMGTALKTIIARMRELSDYGETLDDSIDINTVESQLAYVGIALRDQNGELRSTEDVLDDLGRKWQDLNTNQQAALAKALAGTRQQSRLIALMDGYDRVIELQQISERSAGATMAQAEVYLEGIEASLNKVRVAWEGIVTAVTNSELITATLDKISQVLTNVGKFLDSAPGQVTTIGFIVTASTILLSKKILENNIAKENLKLQNLQSQESIKQQITEKKRLAQLQVEAEYEKEIANQKRISAEISAIEEDTTISGSEKRTKLDSLEKELEISNQKITQLKNTSKAVEQNLKQDQEYAQLQKTLISLQSQNNMLASANVVIMSAKLLIQNLINTGANLLNITTKAYSAITKKDTVVQWANVAALTAKQLAMAGIIGAIAIGAAALVTFLVLTRDTSSALEKAKEKVQGFSNNIYTLTQKSTELGTIVDSFDSIDNKIIKTNADLEEMNNLLDSAADKLSEEQQEEYNNLASTREKRNYLQNVIEESNKEADENRKNIIDTIAGLSSKDRNAILDESNAAGSTFRDAIFAGNNNSMYQAIDAIQGLTTEESSALETVGGQILDNVSATNSWALAQKELNDEMIESIESAEKIKLDDGSEKSAAEILSSDDYSLKQKVKAYESIEESLQGSKEALQGFQDAYSEYSVFAQMEDDVLDFIDTIGLSIDEINELGNLWEKLNDYGIEISKEEYQSLFTDAFLPMLESLNGDIETTVKTVFGTYLNQLEEGSEEWYKAYDAFINAYADSVGVSILDMGQNIDSLKNTINNFYSKAKEWNTMSESDKTSFIQDNADLFAGPEGKDLLDAFESGNYNEIEKALSSSEALQNRIDQRLKEVNLSLQTELAKSAESRNEAYIQQLEDYKAYLEDTENLFKASLDYQLEQQQAQLDEYKSYLEDQQEALEESIEKKKEAYQSYFDAINERQDDEDYQEQTDLLTRNIAKLGSDTSMASKKQQSELINQLEELEKERIQKLRERAQEAVIEKMETTLEEINDKFDKLLNSQQALLQAMTKDLKDPNFINNLMQNNIKNGATALEAQSYLEELKSIFSSSLGNYNWNQVQVKESGQNVVLNVSGKEIVLDDSKQQNLYSVIMKALTEIGAR